MRTLLIIFFGFLVIQSVVGQNYELPKITRTIVGRHHYGKPIEYQFPDSVNKIIADYISKDTDSSVIHFIDIGIENESIELFIFEGSKDALLDTISPLSCLLSSTNRYCNVNGIYLPIYSDLDQEFGNLGFSITGTALVIVFRKIKYKDYRISKVYLAH
ncbi:MAG: hypothetical protein NTU44_20015 [Bacteroidetes bacterium]|nr:hypothetical protein [Bacteroidota bacterium]